MTLFFCGGHQDTDLFYFQPQIFFIPLSHYSSLMILQSEKARISQSNRNPGKLVDGMFIGEAIIESRLLSYRGEDTCCEIEGIIIQFNSITVQKCQNLANSWLVKSLQCQCYQRNASPCLEPSLFDSRKSCIALIIGKQLYQSKQY